MPSETDLANLALVEFCGADAITALSDGTDRARTVSRALAGVVRAVQRRYGWGECKTRARLSRLDETPAFGFAFYYQIPAGWLRTISVHGDEAGRAPIRYSMERGRIATDADAVYLVYLAHEPDPNAWDPVLYRLTGCELAYAIVERVTQSSDKKQEIERELRRLRLAAPAIDAVEDFPESRPTSPWVSARRGRGGH
ncbi:MAG: hypothetical protein ACFB6R_14495 [Alphaproteobacteria bacterium]